MTDQTKLPAILYAAKSTEDTHGSIPTQLNDARALAEREGFEVVGEYRDEAASAFHGDRGDGLAQAMEHCERLGSCALVVQHSDRLARGDAREARHLIEIVLWAIKNDVQLLSVQDREILAGGDLALLLGAIGGMRNHQDSRRKGLAVKDGIRRRAVERGGYVGGRRPYGYEWSVMTAEDGKPLLAGGGRVVRRLSPHPYEAPIVVRMFAEYVEGCAQNVISRGLMNDGVPTLTGTKWYATTIRGILSNPLYIGKVVLGGEAFDGEHEPLIDQETWDQACQLRAATYETVGRGRGRRTSGRHLLTGGLLRCTCGAAMSPVTKNKTHPGDLYEAYSCLARLRQGPEACPQAPLPRDVVDGAILRYFERVAVDVEATRRVIADQVSRTRAELESLSQQAQKELASAEAALARIEGDYVAGRITADQWTRLETRLNVEMEAARAQVEQQDGRRATVEQEIEAFDSEAAIAEELAVIRRLIAGQVQEGSQASLESFRATLKRLFAGFELCSPAKPYGSGVLAGKGDTWAESSADDDKPAFLAIEGGCQLLPVVRTEAVDSTDAAPYVGFPAVCRAALPVHSNLWMRFCAWYSCRASGESTSPSVG